MMRIVGIGANVYDTLIAVDGLPEEDTKKAAEYAVCCGGGPAATGISAAARLGAQCAFIGNVSGDGIGAFLKDDLKRYGVDVSHIRACPGSRAFTSVVLLNRKTATRTCVFDRGSVPKTVLDEEQKELIRQADVLMVDGNDLDAAVEAAALAQESGTLVLYDAGGRYPGVERLLERTDILIPSREFALAVTGASDAAAAAVAQYEAYSPKAVVVTCGKDGGVLYTGETVEFYPAYPAEVVDSNGAGDVFHGAFAFGVAKGFDFSKCCHFSSAVSALKCTGVGARESVPDYPQTVEFLRRNGYEL